MKIGMLWFDDSAQPLNEKIIRAVSYYQEKYGLMPTLCQVHPQTLDNAEDKVDGIRICIKHSVMPNNFWIGIDEEETRVEAQSYRAA